MGPHIGESFSIDLDAPGQGRGHLLTPVGFTNQEPHRHQGQGHVVMPALPSG